MIYIYIYYIYIYINTCSVFFVCEFVGAISNISGAISGHFIFRPGYFIYRITYLYVCDDLLSHNISKKFI